MKAVTVIAAGSMLAALLGGAGTAPAAGRRVAVLPLQYQPAAAEKQATRLREALRRALRKRGLGALSSAEENRLLIAADLGCTTAACRANVARLLRADLLAGGQLTASPAQPGGEVWTLDLFLYDAARGATTGVVRDRCGACSHAALGAFAARLLDRLLEEAGATAGASLVVSSRPPGAAVSVDGVAVGVTPLTYQVAPGRHAVTLALGGHRQSVHEITAEAGRPARVEALLEPEAGAQDGSSGGFLSPRRWRWITLGVAVAALASGITLLALDDRPTCGRDFGNCPELHDTLVGGAILTSVGVLAAGTSGLLFHLSAGDPRGGPGGAALAPWATAGGAGALAKWSF
jgi:hypothetical protein